MTTQTVTADDVNKRLTATNLSDKNTRAYEKSIRSTEEREEGLRVYFLEARVFLVLTTLAFLAAVGCGTAYRYRVISSAMARYGIVSSLAVVALVTLYRWVRGGWADDI